MDYSELRAQPSFTVSRTSLLPIHLLRNDTSFYIKEGLKYLMSLEFISYKAFLGLAVQ